VKKKATVEEIRARFDNDVERFSNLETGQSATVDAPLVLELICQAAAASTNAARALLDIGCGAGNFTLKLMDRLPRLEQVTLVDLSRPMLERACRRIGARGGMAVTPLEGDIREIQLPPESFDIVVAAAVLHHLREEAEWRAVFGAIQRSLRPGGSFWIADLIDHELPEIRELMWRRYGDYLESLKGPEYRDQVLAYVDYEDTPRSLLFQTDLLRQAGFSRVEVLHKNGCFAAFGAVKTA